jgi:flagellar basal-body rod protein FlgF
MGNTVYTSLTRQSGLLKEMQAIAHNVANMATTGFRAEGVLFSEHVTALEGNQPSISFATADAHVTKQMQGALTQTGGQFDFAIEGEGFFQVETPDGVRLTRSGAFFPSLEGGLVTAEGYPLLDAGGAPVFVPADAGSVELAVDGTLSVNGDPLAQVGLVRPAEDALLVREDGVRFAVEGNIDPVETPTLFQGFLEGSNVEPVTEIARMIQVQRAYEMGQGFLDKEDERLRGVMSLITRG